MGRVDFKFFGLVFMTCVWISQGFLPESVLNNSPEQKKSDSKGESGTKNQTFEGLTDFIEYNRYLHEVVQVLETDKDFNEKLKAAKTEDIQSGKIAHNLDFVDHKVRTQLDEIKRKEITRIRELATKYHDLKNDIDREHLKIEHNHIDQTNPHTFEIEDLKRLIEDTAKQLETYDEARKKHFKEHELQKEYEKQEKLSKMTEEERKVFEAELKQKQAKHDAHPKVHHPGSKDQLQEVWNEMDHMEGVEFDPKIFFQLHDLDSNGFWDYDEIEALFVKEVDKVYEEGHEEDDMEELVEELERMREHLYGEVDKNKDALISYEEFLDYTKSPEFTADLGWDTVDHDLHFTADEYLEYEKQRHESDHHVDSGEIYEENHGEYYDNEGDWDHRGEYYEGEGDHYDHEPHEESEGYYEEHTEESERKYSPDLIHQEDGHKNDNSEDTHQKHSTETEHIEIKDSTQSPSTEKK